MGQDNANEVDVALVRLPTSAQCLKDDVEQEDTHASYKASPAPKQWAARKGAVDAEESWAVEKEWGLQHGFRESQLGEIENVLDLMVGKTIPSQNITGCVELDRGSFGEIFSATLHQDGPPPITVRVAVKRVDQHSTPEGTTMPQVFRYVHLEMAVASVLEHPNVVDFLGMSADFPGPGESDAAFHLDFVFGLCENGSLFSNLHCKQLHFSVARKLEFARGIITGMAYVHDQRVLHRDLSSRNILLTADWQIKITDWGCARQVAGDEYHSSTISGSPTYMAPEQLAGDALTFKIDVWALGCVLWEMLMERTPWDILDNKTSRKEMFQHVTKKGKTLQKIPKGTVGEGLWGGVVEVMEKAMHKDAGKRASMAGLLPMVSRLAKQAHLQERLARFYRHHNAHKVADAAVVAKKWCEKQGELEESLRKSYGQGLDSLSPPGSGEQGKPSCRADLAESETSGQLTQEVLKSHTASFDVPSGASSASEDGGKGREGGETEKTSTARALFDLPTVQGSPSPPAATMEEGMEGLRPGALAADVLGERLVRFYAGMNPLMLDSVADIVARLGEKQDALNTKLRASYYCDLATPPAELATRCAVAVQLRGIYGALVLEDTLAKMEAIPKLVHKYRASREDLNAALRKSYGVTLDTPDEEVRARGEVAKRLFAIYMCHDAKKLPKIATLVDQYWGRLGELQDTVRAKYGAHHQVLGEGEAAEAGEAASPEKAEAADAASPGKAEIEDAAAGEAEIEEAVSSEKAEAVEEASVCLTAEQLDASEAPATSDVWVSSEDETALVLSEELRAFYAAVRPEKCGEVEELALKFSTDRASLNANLHTRYLLDLDASPAERDYRGALRVQLEQVYTAAGRKDKAKRSWEIAVKYPTPESREALETALRAKYAVTLGFTGLPLSSGTEFHRM